MRCQGKQYVLAQIENIGTNLVWAEYEGLVNAGANASVRDYLTMDDMVAVRATGAGDQGGHAGAQSS